MCTHALRSPGHLELPTFAAGEVSGQRVITAKAWLWPLLGLTWIADFGMSAAVRPPLQSCGRSSPLMPHEAGEIVG